jgi:hypothetical protein
MKNTWTIRTSANKTHQERGRLHLLSILKASHQWITFSPNPMNSRKETSTSILKLNNIF